jgi:hypothetical protein
MTTKFTYEGLRKLEARLLELNYPDPRGLLAEAAETTKTNLRNYMNGLSSISYDRFCCMKRAVELVEKGILPTLVKDKPPKLKLPKYVWAIYSKRKGVRFLLGFRACVNNQKVQVDIRSFTIHNYGSYDAALTAASSYVEKTLAKTHN